MSSNPCLKKHRSSLYHLSSKYTPSVTSNIFAAEISGETRGSIWSEMCQVGEKLVNDYAWAVPDSRALKVIKHFGDMTGGVIEVGCGKNCYWGKLLNEMGVNVKCYDIDADAGGTIGKDGDKLKGGGKEKKRKAEDSSSSSSSKKEFKTLVGGPEVLLQKSNHNKTLFLCFPDEDFQADSPEVSLGQACLTNFKGKYVVHVGELFGNTISSEQAPFGRSSSEFFQMKLHTEYHCILKIALPTWPHAAESLSVWKLSKTCPITFAADEDVEDDEEETVEYYDIPEDEKLPVDVAAKCCEGLLAELEQFKGR